MDGLITRRAITTGSGSVGIDFSKDFKVVFIDFDGTIIKTEYVDSGDAATAPTDPDRTSEGLTFVEWNNSYSSITHDMLIGATYETTDGKTKAWITLNAVSGLTPTVTYIKSDTSTLTIELRKVSDDSLVWSDTDATSGSSSKTVSGLSTYEDYYFSIWISSGTGTYTIGDGTNDRFVGNYLYSPYNYKVYVGENVTEITTRSLFGSYNVLAIMLPKNVIKISGSAFYNCNAISCLVIPSTTTTIAGTDSFKEIKRIRYISIPDDLATISEFNFTNNYCMISFIFPVTKTTVDEYTFYNCPALQHIYFGNITAIARYAFNSCTTLKYFDFTKCTAVPTLADVNAFGTINPIAKIKVPSALETAWKAATNWVTYADYIVGV